MPPPNSTPCPKGGRAPLSGAPHWLRRFASKVRALLSSTLLRTLAVIAVIVTGLLWFTGRASTAVLVTVIIGIAIVFSADAIVGAIAG
jgi:type IV secretion system protein VirB2